MDEKVEDRLLGCFLGLAVGDAVGTTLEFRSRDTYEHITDMVGGGPFNLERGQWTDDTSMAICLAESILARDEIDAADLRTRWLRWMQHGENSSTGRCFDVGVGTRRALETGEPRGEGNGSIMRLAPVVLRWPVHSVGPAGWAPRDQSKVTHGDLASDCAYILTRILRNLVDCPHNQKCVDRRHRGAERLFNDECYRLGIRELYYRSARRNISSSGYCVHTLEAALWCLHQTTDFRSAVLLAANLGDDADTVAAVTGQLAGAKYGRSGIPPTWLSWLHDGDRLLSIAHKLVAAGEAGAARG